jgi:hypothetical protein
MATPARRTFELTPDGLGASKLMADKLNGVTDLYRTIYNFSGIPSWETAIMDKIFIDFDPEKEDPESGIELYEARKLHEFLEEKGVLHFPYFSGRGFHIFIAANEIRPSQLNNPRTAVKNCHRYIIEEAGIKPDPVTVDLMRIARLPNTRNMKTGLFCIALVYDELYLEKEEIYEMAEKQRPIIPRSDGIKINLDFFDGGQNEVDYAETVESGLPLDLDDDDIPGCVLNNLKHGDCNYLERYAIITALRDLSYSKDDIRGILRESLTSKKYEHCIYEERQLDYLFQRQDLLFPSCSTLKAQGMCLKNCKGQRVYL